MWKSMGSGAGKDFYKISAWINVSSISKIKVLSRLFGPKILAHSFIYASVEGGNFFIVFKSSVKLLSISSLTLIKLSPPIIPPLPPSPSGSESVSEESSSTR